jgi:crotonobetainyl-CoA:carnitine CoA-transferase CaiB-like acyl-CoA transferase
MAKSMAGALDNLTVLDVTHVLAGPFCTYQLALLGADVIKIESPSDPDCARGRGPDADANAQGLGLNYQVQGGNKRALALNLKTPAGREIMLDLVRRADVLVENYRTGALERLGLGYEALNKLNPQLIHCSITGYGDTGPDAEAGAYDNVIQAISGTIGQCGGAKPGVSFIDYSTGYSAAFAVTSALLQRARTGRGCHISVSMLEVAMQMMSPEAAAALHPTQVQRAKEPGIAAYDTADGRLMLGAFRPHQYRTLARLLADLALSAPGLADVEDWPDVWALPEQARRDLVQAFASRTTAEWMDLLRQADLPAAPVQDLTQAVQNPQLADRGYFQKMPAATLPLTAFRMTQGGPALTKAPPRHGEDSHDILSALGMDPERIQELSDQGVIK